MSNKRLLVVGVGANQVGVVAKARELGHYTVAMDGSADAPGLAQADAAAVANILDPSEVVRVALQYAVDGIYPAAEPGVEAASAAARELGLPGLSSEVALRVRNKLVMRQALEAAGVPVPGYCGVKTVDEARHAAGYLGMPVIVKPADANASKGVQRIDYEEDVSLAFHQALKYSRSQTVLIEEYMTGDEYNVDGLMYEGEYHLGGITGKELSAPPFRFDMGIHMPPLVDGSVQDRLVAAVEQALTAIGLTSGTTHVEVMDTTAGPRIVEMAGRPGGGRIPTDLIPLVYGMDYMADSIRVCLGEPPRESRQHARGAAMYWIPSRSGIVTEIRGLAEAHAVPGVVEISMAVRPGDVLGHIVDCVSRDRIGYVLASGSSTEEAIAAAKTARDLVEVVTRHTIE